MDKELHDFTKLKYALYARKSTTDETRQVRSINDQIADCLDFARRNGITIVGKPLQESKSAKKPNLRPVFNQLLKDVRSGKYDGILSWNPDRLARNLKEGGDILDMIDTGVIKDLKFVTHHFTNDASGKMLLGMSFVLSKQYSDDLSQKVTRGVRKSFAEGKSATPKHGYIRDDNGQYQPDGQNYALVRDAWQMRFNGQPLETISDYMNEHGYGRVIKKSGRKVKMDKRMLSDIFHDPIYYGVLVQAGQTVDLRELYDFKEAVSEDDYNAIQRMFNQRSMPRQLKRKTFYPFKMMIICSFCNQPMRTGQSKGKTKRYLFFRCDVAVCSRQKKSVRSKVILDFIYKTLEKGLNFTDKEYRQYYEEMTAIVDENSAKLRVELHSKQGALSAVKQEIKERGLGLLERKVSETVKKVNEERIAELDFQKETLEGKITELKGQLKDPEKEKLSIEEFLNLAKNAAKTVKAGDAIAKDTICRMIFLNFVVDERKVLDYQAKPAFEKLLKLKKLPSSRGAES